MVEVNIVHHGLELPLEISQVIKDSALTVSEVCVRSQWQQKSVIWGVDVSLTDDQNIRQTNKKWRKKDRPTDILSFPLYQKNDLVFLLSDKEINPENQLIKGILMSGNTLIIGDLVISWETLLRQSQQMQKTWQRRTQELSIHGLLHLWGYDHESSESEAETMFTLEDRLLSTMDTGY